jgi:hypothetical protein
LTTTPLGPIKGVPDELIRALNQRFRELEKSRQASSLELSGNLTVNGDAAFHTDRTLTAGDVDISGDLTVDGDVDITGAYKAGGVDITAAVTTQSVVTGSRALGTTYQNTGTTPMMVTVTLQSTAGGGANFGQANILTDAASPPTTVVATTFNGSIVATVHLTISFWVLPGNYYRINQVTTTVVLGSWVEWT